MSQQKTNIFGRKPGQSISGHKYVENNLEEEPAKLSSMNDMSEMQQRLQRELEYNQSLLKDKEETLKTSTDGESNDFVAQTRYFYLEKYIWLKKEAIFNVEKGIWLNKKKIMDIRKKINEAQAQSSATESNVQMFNPYCV